MKRALIVVSAAVLLLAAASVSVAAIPDPGATNTDLILYNPGPEPARLYLTFTSAGSGDTAWTSDGGGPVAAHGGRYLLASQFGGQAAATGRCWPWPGPSGTIAPPGSGPQPSTRPSRVAPRPPTCP